MTRRILLIGVAAALALAGGYAAMRGAWSPQGAVAQSPKGKGKGAVTVDVAQAVKKKVPVRIDLLGNVTPMASVAVKPRIDSEIIEVHFSDGAMVRKGDMLFTLDHRAIDAQIRQTQGILNGAQGAARAGHARRRALRSAGRQERHHPGHAQQRQDPGQHLHRRGRIQHRAARAAAGPARLHVHPRADHRPRQHGERQGRQLRAPGRCRFRSRPSSRSRRST